MTPVRSPRTKGVCPNLYTGTLWRVIRFLAEAFRASLQDPPRSYPRRGGVSFWSCVMEVPLSKLLEEVVDIAWVYLHRTGEIVDGIVAARFLTDTIETMIRRGQRNR